MAVINTSGITYTYDGILADEVLVKPAVSNPDTLKVFRVINGIPSKYQLHTTLPMNPIMQAGTGDCTRTETNDPVSIASRELATAEVSMYVTQCFDVFNNTIFEGALKTGVDVADLSGTALQNLILNELLIPAMSRDLFKMLSFGDTGSGSAFINAFDGLWTTLIAGEATYEVKRATTTIGATLTAGQAILSLEECYVEAENILKQVDASQRKFLVTNSIFEDYQKSLETVNTTDGGRMQIQDGVVKLFYRGIEVVPIIAWDDYLVSSSDSNPHRILYTDMSNHVVGTDKPSDVTKLDAWYSKDDKKQKYEASCKIGYNYVHGDLSIIAY